MVWDQLLQQWVCITKQLLHTLSETTSGNLIFMLVVTNLSGQMLTFDGTLERCCRHGWSSVLSVQDRWQTACIVSRGWALCWCQGWGSGPWQWWSYGMGWRLSWIASTAAFNCWSFKCIEILWPDPEARCHAIHPQPSTHVSRICAQFLEADNIPVLTWPADSLDTSPIQHVWDPWINIRAFVVSPVLFSFLFWTSVAFIRLYSADTFMQIK